MVNFEKHRNLHALTESTSNDNKELLGWIAKMLVGEKFKVETIVYGIVGIFHFDVNVASEKENPIASEESGLRHEDLRLATCPTSDLEH